VMDGTTDELAGTCGNGAVDPGEDCDGDPPRVCDSSCGSVGEQTCRFSCTWSACSAPAETCNLRDDDCDGETDETIAKLGDERLISTEGRRTARAAIAWAHGAYAVAYEDGRDAFDRTEVFLSRIAADGSDAGPDVRITDRSDPWGTATFPALAATTDGFGIAWSDLRDGNSEIYSMILGPDGVPISGGGLRVTGTMNESIAPSLAWSGGGFGVVWAECGWLCTVNFARLDTAGAKVGLDVVASGTEAMPTLPSLVFADDGFGLAWTDDRSDPTSSPSISRDLFFVGLNATGTVVRAERRLAPAFAPTAAPAASIAWTGAEYAVVWPDVLPTADRIGIWFAQLDSGGAAAYTLVVEEGIVAAEANVAWAGDHFALVWIDSTGIPGDPARVYFARLSPFGIPIGSTIAITAGEGDAHGPRVAWAGEQYGIAWTDTRDGPDGNGYFARVGCR